MGRIVTETLLDYFLEIDAIIGDIIFFYGLAVADHILHSVREKRAFLWATAEEKRRLGGTRFIKNACMLCKRQLGAFAQSAMTFISHSIITASCKFSIME
jgi:hypothetical protein